MRLDCTLCHTRSQPASPTYTYITASVNISHFKPAVPPTWTDFFSVHSIIWLRDLVDANELYNVHTAYRTILNCLWWNYMKSCFPARNTEWMRIMDAEIDVLWRRLDSVEIFISPSSSARFQPHTARALFVSSQAKRPDSVNLFFFLSFNSYPPMDVLNYSSKLLIKNDWILLINFK